MCCHLPEFIFPATVLPIYFGSTNPGISKQLLVTFAATFAATKCLNILEVLFPVKCRRESSAFWKYCSRKKIAECQTPNAARSSAGPILPFFIFIFPGTILPFCYFSVVRKVPEKPVLFLPHPLFCKQQYCHCIICSYF